MAFLFDIVGGIIGPWQVVIIIVIALLIFGKRLPEIARSLGRSLTEFRKGLKETKDEIENAANADKPGETEKQSDDS